MNYDDQNSNYNKLQLSLYLLPVFGTILALVDVLILSKQKNHQRPSPKGKTISLSLKLGLTWIVMYSGLWLGSGVANDIFALRLLYLNGLFTTGYFFACGYFLWRIWHRKL